MCFKRSLFIFFLAVSGCLLSLWLSGCSTYVAAEDTRLQEGWVNPETYQFRVSTRWDVKNYYINRYEPSLNRKPTRFVYLKRAYTKFFRSILIKEVTGKLAVAANVANPQLSVDNWKKVIAEDFKDLNDLNIILVKEDYYQTGLIEYVFQMKKKNFKAIIECDLAGGITC